MNKLTREQLIKKNKKLKKELALKNRELEIEAALERIRSRSMAMHKSDELMEVIQLVYEQLVRLNFKINSANLFLNYKESDDFIFWTAIPGRPYPTEFFIPYFDHPVFIRFKEAKKKQLQFTAEIYSFEEKNRFWMHFFEHAPTVTEERKKYILSCAGLAMSHVYMNTISLLITNYDGIPFSDEENAVLRRIGKVFEQTYTRFLDLQKAENQAREAQIEAALEKVRSRSLAMHKGEELVDVLNTVHEKLTELNVDFDTVNILIFSELTRDIEYWTINKFQQNYLKYNFPYVDYSAPRDIAKARADKLSLFSKNYHGKEHDEIVHYLFEESDFRKVPEERKQIVRDSVNFTVSIGIGTRIGILINSYYRKAFSTEENEILKRFTTVFEQAYIRFLDLQKAEAQTLVAIKRASVDRIRAEIASMRTTSDLERIQPLIWNELKTLGVPFIRCGVFIMDEAKQEVQIFLSTPDGKSIAAFRLPFYSTEQSKQIVTHWQQKQIFKDHMDEAAFAEYTKNLVQQGAVAGDEKYVTENRPTDLYLHFLPFLQGMLYVGNDAPLKEDELQLVQNLAEAFSTAYARYEDFRQLEEAKNQIEKTLTELKSTQAQLIQAEKMASLGELTAGIAHEIQNPLNFVNNFSEVSNELLHEMKEELATGNMQLVTELADDIIQNLGKINHHGKRADAIVKGMLQHSRTSNGFKEPTDINALADEYLRLSYHGLRAKDKTFNAKFETDFDPNLPKIDVIPQDIGRVLLNLINNAFYAVHVETQNSASLQQTPQKQPGYNPKVIISTKNMGNHVEIRVKDNGPGIPPEIKDKIFQPFFTTKPTGQGTGLGLSLSYDIVKAHGGELKVETKPAHAGADGEENGSEFIITLPVT